MMRPVLVPDVYHHGYLDSILNTHMVPWPDIHSSCVELVPYSRKLSREKTFGFVAICESFLHEIWSVASFGTAKAGNLRKFSPQKLYFHQFAKVFSLESLPLYGIQNEIFVWYRRTRFTCNCGVLSKLFKPIGYFNYCTRYKVK